MSEIKVLPVNISNMIAAGEVVQRPASVVKELMENAVDAGACQVNVIVTDAGRTLIQVIDNGCGMSPAEAVLCFERHATSKISSVGDLNRIVTFGFRGEALASIAAVSEVTLRTRRSKDETATQVRIEDSGKVSTSSVGAPVGSNFAVRNLFYNTPARRKFLKSDTVELKHIVEEFTRVAITRPDVSFSLVSNGKEIFVLKPAKSVKFRVLDLMGAAVVGEVVDLEADTSLLKLRGFVGRPDAARKMTGNQMFFVNGRFFRSAYLHKAVMKAYEDMIPEGMNPPYFIFLEIDPSSVDVNIHPTKTEIKFEDDSLIFQTIYACIKETLGRNSFNGSIDFETEGSVEFPQLGRSFEEYRGVSSSPKVEEDPLYNPFEPEKSFSAGFPPEKPVRKNENYGLLFEDRQEALPRLLIIQGKFIVSPSSSGMMVVNVKRARERILYERFLKALGNHEFVTQESMFPVTVQVGTSQRLLFEENAELLGALGFDISSFGTDTVVINGVPQGYSCESGKVQQMVEDILLILSGEHNSLPEMMEQEMARKFAALGASGSAQLTSPLEAQRLLDALFGCDNSEFTAGGRKIVAIVSTADIDKLF